MTKHHPPKREKNPPLEDSTSRKSKRQHENKTEQISYQNPALDSNYTRFSRKTSLKS